MSRTRRAPAGTRARPLALPLAVPLADGRANDPTGAVPSRVTFYQDTLFRSGGRGDNW